MSSISPVSSEFMFSPSVGTTLLSSSCLVLSKEVSDLSNNLLVSITHLPLTAFGIYAGVSSFFINSTADNVRIQHIAIVWFVFAMLCDVRPLLDSSTLSIIHTHALPFLLGNHYGDHVLVTQPVQNRLPNDRHPHNQDQPNYREHASLSVLHFGWPD